MRLKLRNVSLGPGIGSVGKCTLYVLTDVALELPHQMDAKTADALCAFVFAQAPNIIHYTLLTDGRTRLPLTHLVGHCDRLESLHTDNVFIIPKNVRMLSLKKLTVCLNDSSLTTELGSLDRFPSLLSLKCVHVVNVRMCGRDLKFGVFGPNTKFIDFVAAQRKVPMLEHIAMQLQLTGMSSKYIKRKRTRQDHVRFGNAK